MVYNKPSLTYETYRSRVTMNTYILHAIGIAGVDAMLRHCILARGVA